jgi:hypothetical protein
MMENRLLKRFGFWRQRFAEATYANHNRSAEIRKNLRKCIGYHPRPTNFLRFTREGIRELVDQAGLRCYDIKVAVGTGRAFYRIAVEFLAILVSRFATSLYLPAKGALALLLCPVTWLDPVLAGPARSDRIPGGYLIVAGRS